MPRLARLDAPGVLHHIIIRGIERRVIFKDDLDRENFLERMSNLIPETQSVCYAWVFMSNQKRAWQETGYVLSVFGGSPAVGRRSYAAYVKAGSRQGRRPELIGGGLIRSLGGWAASKKLRLKGQDRLKGDERILGDSDFVTSILAEANENLDRYYELKSQGYTIERVEKRVMEIFGVQKEVIYSKGRRKIQVAARSLLCYWSVRELGFTATELAKRLGMTQPAVSYAVSRGEQIAKERSWNLIS
jgi:hypothetical protein